jgi:hypothetical protein
MYGSPRPTGDGSRGVRGDTGSGAGAWSASSRWSGPVSGAGQGPHVGEQDG